MVHDPANSPCVQLPGLVEGDLAAQLARLIAPGSPGSPAAGLMRCHWG